MSVPPSSSSSSSSSLSLLFPCDIDLSPHELQSLYRWIDSIPLTRPKKNIHRDFSDGTLVSEVIAHFYKNLVDLHNYSVSNSLNQKTYNWRTLNHKIFTKKLGFSLNSEQINDLIQAKKGGIERFMLFLQQKLAEYGEKQSKKHHQKQFSSSSSSSSSPGLNEENEEEQEEKEFTQGKSKKTLSTEQAAEIEELRETVDVLSLKVEKLEQLLQLKNTKILTLQNKLEEQEIMREQQEQQRNMNHVMQQQAQLAQQQQHNTQSSSHQPKRR